MHTPGPGWPACPTHRPCTTHENSARGSIGNRGPLPFKFPAQTVENSPIARIAASFSTGGGRRLVAFSRQRQLWISVYFFCVSLSLRATSGIFIGLLTRRIPSSKYSAQRSLVNVPVFKLSLRVTALNGNRLNARCWVRASHWQPETHSSLAPPSSCKYSRGMHAASQLA